jgi:hypothetical protein
METRRLFVFLSFLLLTLVLAEGVVGTAALAKDSRTCQRQPHQSYRGMGVTSAAGW